MGQCVSKLVVVVLAVALASLGGCRSDFSPTFEAFSQNKLAVLARNTESVRDSQKAASEQITKTVERIKQEAWTGANPMDAYDMARRAESSCETRVRAAQERLKLVEASADLFFSQWRREIREYEDSALKASSRDNLARMEKSFNDALAQMHKADDGTQPALAAIQDQVLFLKHHRNFPEVPERPPNSADPTPPAERLVELTEAASRAADDFAAAARSMPPPPPPAK
jgi:hypothetical protein